MASTNLLAATSQAHIDINILKRIHGTIDTLFNELIECCSTGKRSYVRENKWFAGIDDPQRVEAMIAMIRQKVIAGIKVYFPEIVVGGHDTYVDDHRSPKEWTMRYEFSW